MGTRTSSVERGQPVLATAFDIPSFLGEFFTSGLAAPGHGVEISAGLWPLLTFCWSLNSSQRETSALCQHLIAEPGFGWREEADVVEALARRIPGHNPAQLRPESVQPFLAAFLAAGESARGRRGRLDLQLDFLLPRLGSHPFFTPQVLRACLEQSGTSATSVDEHLAAVHPERRPYLGTWRLRLGDCLRAVQEPSPAEEIGGGRMAHNIEIRDEGLGNRSRVALDLIHTPEFRGYFDLSLTHLAAARGELVAQEAGP